MTFAQYAAKSVSDARVLVQVGSIYVLRNKNSGKCYIGQTIQKIERRINAHKIRTGSAISGAIAKYGIESFDQIGYVGIPIELLDYFESELITRLNTISPNGYNLDTGGALNRKYCEVARAKMRLAKLGKPQSEESNLKRSLALRGRSLSSEHRKKIGDAHRGSHLSEEIKMRLRETRRPVSEETKIKLSLAKKGKPSNNKFAKEMCMKMGTANRGRKRAEETKEKLRLVNLGTKRTEEVKAKMRLAQIERRARERMIAA